MGGGEGYNKTMMNRESKLWFKWIIGFPKRMEDIFKHFHFHVVLSGRKGFRLVTPGTH